MGNAALRDIAVIEPISYDDVSQSIVAIDAHNWLYRYLTTTVRWTSSATYTTTDGTKVANLIGIIQGLPRFLEHDIVPVFVFDGHVSEYKKGEIRSRRRDKELAAQQAKAARDRGDIVEAARYDSRTQRLTDTIQETTRTLLDLLDVPRIDAPAEGEAQAAHMVRTGTADYAGTEDYDALLYGCPLTLRGLTGKGDPECMYLTRTLEDNGLTQEQLVDVAILCGTDFNDGIHGIGPKTAIKRIHEYGDIFGVLDEINEVIDDVDIIRKLFLAPDVTDDFSIDIKINPDIDAAKAYVCETWEIPTNQVERGFDRIESSLVQTGLDQWS